MARYVVPQMTYTAVKASHTRLRGGAPGVVVIAEADGAPVLQGEPAQVPDVATAGHSPSLDDQDLTPRASSQPCTACRCGPFSPFRWTCTPEQPGVAATARAKA